MAWVKMQKATSSDGGGGGSIPSSAKVLFNDGTFSDLSFTSDWEKTEIVDYDGSKCYRLYDNTKYSNRNVAYSGAINTTNYSKLIISFKYVEVNYQEFVIKVGTSSKAYNLYYKIMQSADNGVNTIIGDLYIDVSSVSDAYITLEGNTGNSSGNWVDAYIDKIYLA